MDKRYGRIPRIWCAMVWVLSAVMLTAGITLFYTDGLWLSAVLIGCGAAAFAASSMLSVIRKKTMEKFLEIVAGHDGEITSNILSVFPIPILVANVDGSIRWHNTCMTALFGGKGLAGLQVANVIDEVKWGDVLKTKDEYKKDVVIEGRHYELTGKFVKEKTPSADSREVYSVYIYLIDRSQLDKIQKLYEDEKTDIAVICIDNYDEVMQRIDDEAEERIVSGVRKCLGAWAQQGGAVIKRQENDRYFLLFDHSKLEKYIEDKFSILENVRKIGEEYNAPVSISIGIGSGGTLIENEQYSRSAMEMTQGRGGDQVCVKTKEALKFYGGSTKEYEKNNRVKTRSFAVALKQFMLNADSVFLMGHSTADYDCFGAAMALQRAARELKRRPYIVLDNNSPAIAPLLDEINDVEEYEGMFIRPEEAEELINGSSLLIILDTHRPKMLPCPQLLERTGKVVVIDHHRRSMEFINPCALVYHEPYASSTCEMVTEIMDYMDMGSKMTCREAECLYTGILMDTKNFLVKTSVRTFEAASYLRRLGINTLDVKKLFNIDKTDYAHKVDIVKTAVDIGPGFAMAVVPEPYPKMRVLASQAADEMLNIGETKASFVIYPMDSGYGLCARSIGNINVQLIMEKLGGGGHATVAGAQLKTKDLEAVKRTLIKAVQEYLRNI